MTDNFVQSCDVIALKHITQTNEQIYLPCNMCKIQDLAKGIDLGEQIDLILLDLRRHLIRSPRETTTLQSSVLWHQWVDSSLDQGLYNLQKPESNRGWEIVTHRTCPFRNSFQGSIFRPLMFVLFINDIRTTQSSTVILLADDCVLYRKIQYKADSKLLREDMYNLLRLESDWQMEFHPSKCQLLRVTNKRIFHKI